MRTCLDCGRRIARGSRCDRHAAAVEQERQSRQWYRVAYASSTYQENRRIRFACAGGRCERILADATRCPEPAAEAHHTHPLSSARSLEEALALCDWRLLEAVCADHNPRGGVPSEHLLRARRPVTRA